MTGKQEAATSEGEPTDAVCALAEAYARIEYVEENTDECVDELENAKNAISAAQAALFDTEVDRAHQKLTNGK
jgi:multidrug resistance efflux pump